MQQEFSDSPDRPFAAASLAIEVIGREGSVALMNGRDVIAARSLDSGARAAAGLAPQIASLAKEFLPGGALDALAGISVAVGPGSFTGLRIAVTTAKTLAYALQIPVVAVNSLTAIAALVRPDLAAPDHATAVRQQVLVGLSAYRGQVYRGWFSVEGAPEIDLISADQWKSELNRSIQDNENAAESCDDRPQESPEKNVILMGDRSVFDRTKLAFAPQQWRGDGEIWAVGVGRIGAEMLRRGETTSAIDLVPDYLRPSAAEEKASGTIG
ncbi:tRNA (adenosine(37)-N6)-threonylcarbamoyltransferase complex dimerization subunit type 1 TsaB [Aporhodopirellula aestuarii]|nr:tRNA (adenosine(37)-N6)-threonylcarbamoyltransferase complex dimerization subunit type 1 TsaB [Aporhodopirellula aestuarii]